MTDEVVGIERRGPVVLWTLRREARRNAINPEVAAALCNAAQGVLDDPSVRAVVLTGQGDKAFISGADLDFLSSTADGTREAAQRRDAFNELVFDFTRRLSTLPALVIAAIRGHVMGGGCEIAVACDVRVAAPSARFTFKHAAMGVTPGWGGLARLSALVPRGSAARLLMAGDAMNAEEALRVGLIDALEADGDVLDRALVLAQAAAALCPEAIAEIKSLLGRAYTGQLSAANEQASFLRRARSSDHAEALRALSEGRAPQFQPRPRQALDLPER